MVASVDKHVDHRLAWVDDEDVDAFLRAHGSSRNELQRLMLDAGLYKERKNAKTKRPEKHFRVQISLTSTIKKQVNYLRHPVVPESVDYSYVLRCYVTVASMLKASKSFSWPVFVADVFNVRGNEHAIVNGVRHIKKIFADCSALFETELERSMEKLVLDSEKLTEEVPELTPSFPDVEEHEGLSMRTASPKKLRSIRSDFEDDPLLALGFARDADLGTDTAMRLEEIIKDTRNRQSTYKQWITVQNLFLLFTHHRDQAIWEMSSMILVNEQRAHAFLEAALNKEVALTGKEPSFRSVVNGQTTYRPTRSQGRFSDANATKFVNAISDLYRKQRLLLSQPVHPSLRDFPLIATWLLNVSNAELTHLEKSYVDRQRDVFLEDPFQMIERQSDHLLRTDTWNSHRLRCLSLMQLWSISRWNECSYWRICDLFMHEYTPQGNPNLRTTIKVVNVLQFRYKTAKTKSSKRKKAQKKLIVRRCSPSICPQSSLAIWLFERFVMDGEKEIDVLADPTQWQVNSLKIMHLHEYRYDVRIIRSRADATRSPSSNAIGDERTELGLATNSNVCGLVNHLPRQIGTYIGKMCNLTDDQIAQLGLWNVNTQKAHYFHVFEVDVITKLSGFKDPESFMINRSLASTRDFISKHPGTEAMFDGFLSAVDDDQVEEAAEDLRGRKERTPVSVLRTLRVLKEVFWQDIAFYKEHYPQLRMFSCDLLTRHHETLEAWIDYVRSFEVRDLTPGQGNLNARGLVVESEAQALAANQLAQTNQRLDATNCLLHRMLKRLDDSKATNDKQLTVSVNMAESSEMVPGKRLRSLNGKNISDFGCGDRICIDMRLEEVFELWMEKVKVEGVVYSGGLRSVIKEDESRPAKMRRIDSSRRSYIRRVRAIAEAIEDNHRKVGDMNKAIEIVEKLRLRPDGTVMALWELAESISHAKS